MESEPVTWRRSSACGVTDCLEVAWLMDSQVALRSTLAPQVGPVVCTREEWAAFIAGVKAGEFDQPSIT